MICRLYKVLYHCELLVNKNKYQLVCLKLAQEQRGRELTNAQTGGGENNNYRQAQFQLQLQDKRKLR